MQKRIKEQIEQLLGKSIDLSQKETIKNLNDMPLSLIEEARLLPPRLSRKYLEYFISPIDKRRYFPSFFSEVIRGDMSASTWRKGALLSPDPNKVTFIQILEKGHIHIEQLLGVGLNEKWMRIPMKRGNWKKKSPHSGAPHVIRPSLDYCWTVPDGVVAGYLSDLEYLEPVKNILIATRRWIAWIITRQTVKYDLIEKIREPLELVQELYPEVQALSDDAQIAIQALYLEQTQLEKDDSVTPGYLGPDEWYMGDFASLWQRFGRLIGRNQTAIGLKQMIVDTDTNWDELVIKQLQLGTYREKTDSHPSDGLDRIWRSLVRSSQIHLESAVYRALMHSNPDVRDGALRLVETTFAQVQYEQIQEVALHHLDIFRDLNGHDRRADLIRLAASAPNESGQAFRRQIAFDSEYGNSVLAMVAKHDTDWLVENGWALLNPAIDSEGKRLNIVIANLSRRHPDKLKQLVDQLADDLSMHSRLISTIRLKVRDVVLRDMLIKQIEQR